MTQNRNEPPTDTIAGDSIINLIIRLGLVGLLAYLSWEITAPFLTIMLWSAILSTALYPFFEWLAHVIGSRRVAAAALTILCLMIVIGPVTWLGFGLATGVEYVAKELDAGNVSIPQPRETIKNWPIIGERLHRLWSVAAIDIKATLIELLPRLKPFGARLLDLAEYGFLGLLKFLVSIAIAGFLFSPGPALVQKLGTILDRVARPRGRQMIPIVGATIRNVSRGVIGIALLQAVLAGVGFLAASMRGAGVLAFLTLALSIIQIGPGLLFLPIIFWSWTSMAATNALIFTIYMVFVGLIDNLLRPLVIARGISTPMPVILIGVIGGTIAYGIVGLFFGPIVLSVAWALAVAWMQDESDPRDAAKS